MLQQKNFARIRSGQFWEIVPILVLAAITFSPVLGFSFVYWDDNVMVLTNSILKQPLLAAFQSAFGAFFMGDYIPLTLMSFWADAHVAGIDGAGWFHGVNLVLQLANVFLLWYWLRNMALGRWGTLFICLVFALHPLQVESVAWVSERKGLLCGFFTLLAMLSAQQKDSRFLSRACYPAFFLLAVLCKANTILAPVFLAFYDRLVLKKSARTVVKDHGAAFAIMALFIVVRILAYGNYTATNYEEGYFSALTSPQRWLNLPLPIFNALGFYLHSLIVPSGLSIIYPRFSAATEIGWNLGVLVLAVIAVWFGWRKTRDTRFILFSLFFVLFIFPVLQIVPKLSYVNDRYLYFPIIGLAGCAYLMIVPYAKYIGGRVRLVSFSLLAVALAWTSYGRAMVWQSNLSLWQDTVVKSPWSGIAHLNLGLAYEHEGRYPEAVAEYELASGMGPDVESRALSNLSLIFLKPDLPQFFSVEKSGRYLQKAVEKAQAIDEKLILEYNLARFDLLTGEKDEARRLANELLNKIGELHDSRFLNLAEMTKALLVQLNSAE